MSDAAQVDQEGQKLANQGKTEEAGQKFAEAAKIYSDGKKWPEAEVESRKAAEYLEDAAKKAAKNEGKGGKSELYEQAAQLREAASQALEELASSVLSKKPPDKKTAKGYLTEAAKHLKKAAEDHRAAADADAEPKEAAGERQEADRDESREKMYEALVKTL